MNSSEAAQPPRPGHEDLPEDTPPGDCETPTGPESCRRVVVSDRRLGPGRGETGRERLLALIGRLEPDAASGSIQDAAPNGSSLGRAQRRLVAEETRDRAGGAWRFRVSARAVRGFLLLALVAVAAAIVFLPEGGRPGTQGTSGTATRLSEAASGRPGSAADAAGATESFADPSPTADGSEVAVHVVGAVRRPGLVRLPAGSVVDEAVRAAGGGTPAAAMDAVNLAEALRPGAQIRVPTHEEAARGEHAGQLVGAPRSDDVAPGSGNAGAEGSGSGSASTEDFGGTKASGARSTVPANVNRVDLNTATAEQLQALPRVGPKLAQKILDYRRTHGRFASVQELDAVPGIGPAMLAALEPMVSV